VRPGRRGPLKAFGSTRRSIVKRPDVVNVFRIVASLFQNLSDAFRHRDQRVGLIDESDDWEFVNSGDFGGLLVVLDCCVLVIPAIVFDKISPKSAAHHRKELPW
jgi:hypothetical protein